MKTASLTLFLMFTAASVSAQPLKIATWNMAWLANDPLTSKQDAQVCIKQDQAKVDLDKREPAACRKGNPFSLSAGYAGLTRAAYRYNFDIIGFQEVEGL